jgi:hypothetical protein
LRQAVQEPGGEELIVNRQLIQRPPKLKGVGTALLVFARTRSMELGYKGRVGLHSLPGVLITKIGQEP